MRVGGPAERILTASTREELIERACELWETGEDWLLLGGGSNTVVSDSGYPGTVLLVRTSGIEVIDADDMPAAESEAGPEEHETGSVRIRVQAGHNWDDLVSECVTRGWAGIEALSGIPGLVGAAPVQNIGAYGQELSDVLHSIEFLDAETYETRRMAASELELGYRDSVLKRGLEGVVLSVDLVLADAAVVTSRTRETPQPVSEPIHFPQLAKALGVELGMRVRLGDVRESVLSLRASKGMVLDEQDYDTWSAGSFFINPIVSERFARTLPEDAPKFLLEDAETGPAITPIEEVHAGYGLRLPQPASERRVKLSAAWLIEQAGVPRGYRLPGSGASTSKKHSLAITNRGAASAEDVAELARFIVQRVQQEFGVVLAPEPNLYGLEL